MAESPSPHDSAAQAPAESLAPSASSVSSARTLIADEFIRGLRIATLGVTTAVLCVWFLPIAVASPGAYARPTLEYVSLAVLVALLLLAVVTVARDRPWGRLRWPMVLVALVATVLATAAVRPEQMVLPPHWSWKVFGWFAVLLLMDLPLGWFFGALAFQQALSLVQVLAAGQGDRPTLVEMGVTSLLVASWQGAVAVAAVALQRSGAVARETAAEEERLRLSERVAEQVHGDRQARYAELTVTTTPLLQGIADGLLDPADPGVQRACSVEAARMRRLFAESDEVSDPLSHEISACIDVAERQGTAVQASVRGTLPPVPLAARRALTEPVIAVLAGARSSARLTVVGRDDQVTLSVVVDGALDLDPALFPATPGPLETPHTPSHPNTPGPLETPHTPSHPDTPGPLRGSGPLGDPGVLGPPAVPHLPGSPGGPDDPGTPGPVQISRLISGDRLWLDVTWRQAG
ncbi:hypothetical protein [Kineosporia succinea]|uniref:Signal transduction histidine kinase n=1 Tax=Kineosporia succinea TaxID=84632 RepID=A0ABT9NWZ4_9ACTN|nr:hypothetical protein [Kineosporia succinea]MDP9824951.1 hypothetical protein [Kineosporia succinea]